ncbi:MAG: formylglycine-generating enzyme family protein [Deltaproteobacteria bacterium]|nr:formylglycine-generating enzyme family protein [Deltaproteobacteria bacterium]
MSALLVLLPSVSACDKGDTSEAADASKASVAAKTPEAAKATAAKAPAKAAATKAADAKAPDAKAPDAKPPAERCPKGTAFIQSGKFFMGSDSENPLLTRARPAHPVEVSAACLDTHEITVAQYKACVGAGDCKPAFRETWWPQGKTDEATWVRDKTVHAALCNAGKPDRLNHPINCITWPQADGYCKAMGGRLPTEAEWEYAARGSDGRTFPWGDEVPDPERTNACDQRCQAWRNEAKLTDYGMMFDADDGYEGTAPVGSYPKGRAQSGLEDMVGNVFEWTSDRFYTYTTEFQNDPTGPDEGEARVIRGGAFNSFRVGFADPAFRHSMHENAHTHGIGFRCAYTPTGS